jgi:hypothetical protein
MSTEVMVNAESQERAEEIANEAIFKNPTEWEREFEKVTNEATPEDIRSHLQRLGLVARVYNEGRYEGQPSWIEIGEYDADEARHEFTLYYELDDFAEDAGLGWYLTIDHQGAWHKPIENMTAESVALIAKALINEKKASK